MDTSFHRFLKYAALNITGMLGISCYILADTFFIANGIGADGLAALNLAIPIYSFIHGCALMLGTGGGTKFIIAQCQGEHRRANIIFTNSIKIGMIFALIFICSGLFLSEALTTFLKADAALWDMTNTYLKIILLFSPFFIVNEQLLAYTRSDGNPSLAMIAMVSGSIANIILDYIFIYPMQMGIFGAVLATGIAPIVSMLILFRHIINGRCGFHIIRCSIQSKTVIDIVTLGFPSLVTELSAGVVMIVFNLLIMKHVGNTGIAAYGIVANIALVTTAIFSGLAQGIQPLISEAFSTNAHKSLQSFIRWSFTGAAVLSIVLFAVMYRYAAPITALFNNTADHQLQILGVQGVQLYFTSLPLTAFNLILCALFTAVEKPFPAHIISLLRGLIIILPLSFWMAKHHGMIGIWLTVTAVEFLTILIAILLWRKLPITENPSL